MKKITEDYDYTEPNTNPFQWLCSVIDFNEKREYLKYIHVVGGTAFACSGYAMHWCDVSGELLNGVYDPLTFYPVNDPEISKYSTRIAKHEEHCTFQLLTPEIILASPKWKKLVKFGDVAVPMPQFLTAENLERLPPKESFLVNPVYISPRNSYLLGSLPAVDRRELNYKIMGVVL